MTKLNVSFLLKVDIFHFITYEEIHCTFVSKTENCKKFKLTLNYSTSVLLLTQNGRRCLDTCTSR